jgi:hypothetical protein
VDVGWAFVGQGRNAHLAEHMQPVGRNSYADLVEVVGLEAGQLGIAQVLDGSKIFGLVLYPRGVSVSGVSIISILDDGRRLTVVLVAKAYKGPFQGMLDLPEQPDGFLLGLMGLTKLDCLCCCLGAGVEIGVLALRPNETWKPMHRSSCSHCLPCRSLVADRLL